MRTEQAERHYWLPVPNEDIPGGTRHAFRGVRWDGTPSAVTVCGQFVALAQPSEIDWINFPTCSRCNSLLKGEFEEG
ncbi:hypothetical protein [Saccharopolyspora mangrovi]|uniref:DUF3039 domain-containing protein n=1 Tax=Saccharopolyspora mangrovi TaxID=3082379 RepID=A0ABU6A7F9_9PSEU|nr:hypothetical protein [Saccharopolyspora sp. S2-29]MEB3367429.1 hypothetical protein [Saccharopolyspora sp. S2-29]